MKKLVGALAIAAVTLASCGTRGPDPSNVAVGGGPAVGPATTQPARSQGDWGTLKNVCGPREKGGQIPKVADKADTQGLTDNTMTLGTVSDPGFVGRAGLNQELFDSGTAFVKWCNDAGGINGKKLTLNKHDAKLTEYKPAITQACKTDFAMVGGGGVQDNLWPETGAACGLVDFAGYAVTPQKAGLSGKGPAGNNRTVESVPNPRNGYVIGGALIVAKKFPGSKDHLGFVYGDFQTLSKEKEKNKAAYEANGFTTVHQAAYAILGESNWKPFATALKADGVRFVRFIGEPVFGGNLEAASAAVGFRPDVRIYDANFYDPVFIKTGGAATNGAFVTSVFVPMEEADQNPATKQYLDVLAATNGKTAILGMQSMSSWLLFATVAKKCDMANNLRRECLLHQAAKVTRWTGGGLHAPTSPGTNTASACVMVITVKDGKFTRYAPDKGFACDPSYRWSAPPSGAAETSG